MHGWTLGQWFPNTISCFVLKQTNMYLFLDEVEEAGCVCYTAQTHYLPLLSPSLYCRWAQRWVRALQSITRRWKPSPTLSLTQNQKRHWCPPPHRKHCDSFPIHRQRHGDGLCISICDGGCVSVGWLHVWPEYLDGWVFSVSCKGVHVLCVLCWSSLAARIKDSWQWIRIGCWAGWCLSGWSVASPPLSLPACLGLSFSLFMSPPPPSLCLSVSVSVSLSLSLFLSPPPLCLSLSLYRSLSISEYKQMSGARGSRLAL